MIGKVFQIGCISLFNIFENAGKVPTYTTLETDYATRKMEGVKSLAFFKPIYFMKKKT